MVGAANRNWPVQWDAQGGCGLVHDRHHEVQNDKMGPQVAHAHQPLPAIGRTGGAIALLLQDQAQDLGTGGFVVDDKNGFHEGLLTRVALEFASDQTARRGPPEWSFQQCTCRTSVS